MLERINQFFDSIHNNPIEFYNECGLQHELALFLRLNFPDLTVKLEYPTSRIFNPLPQFLKKEIDIYISTKAGQQYIIELKMPKGNGGVPKAMYHAIEDVKFLEQLRHADITGCYSILATPSIAFWQPRQAVAGIYTYFGGQQITIQSIGITQLPTFLQNHGGIELENVYQTNWVDYVDPTNQNWKYYLLEI